MAALLGRKPKAATLTLRQGQPKVRIAAGMADGPAHWDTVVALKEKLSFGYASLGEHRVAFEGRGRRGLRELARWLAAAAVPPILKAFGLTLNAALGLCTP